MRGYFSCVPFCRWPLTARPLHLQNPNDPKSTLVRAGQEAILKSQQTGMYCRLATYTGEPSNYVKVRGCTPAGFAQLCSTDCGGLPAAAPESPRHT